jgi:hypothetical protein
LFFSIPNSAEPQRYGESVAAITGAGNFLGDWLLFIIEKLPVPGLVAQRLIHHISQRLARHKPPQIVDKDWHKRRPSLFGDTGADARSDGSLGHIAYKLIAHPSITSVQGLKGKIVGSSRIGAGTDYALQRLLPKLGLIPGKDVQLIPTGVSESDRRLLMLLQGKIDATLGTEDNLLQLAARGMKFSVLADLYENGVYTTGSDIATGRHLLKDRPRQLKAFLMALTEGTWVGRTNKEIALRIYRKYLKIEDSKLLDSMHKNYLLGTIPARPFPNEEAIQNDIEDLSHTYPHLRGKKAAEFLDLSLLKSMEEDGFFKRLHGK